MARYQEKIKEAYLLIIGERKRAPEILSKLFFCKYRDLRMAIVFCYSN